MIQKPSLLIVTALALIVLGISCNQSSNASASDSKENGSKKMYGGAYDSELAWGKHLVQVGGCGDCHTPKKMGPMGPEQDSSLLLSGHPAKMPAPPYDPKEEKTIIWNDPTLNINWPIDKNPILSNRDKSAPVLHINNCYK
jgi:hypothetical protein